MSAESTEVLLDPETCRQLLARLQSDAEALSVLVLRIRNAAEGRDEDDDDGFTVAERESILQLDKIANDGLASVARGIRSQRKRDELRTRLVGYSAEGLQTLLRVPIARGNDFTVRQLQGQWAEEVVLSIHGANEIRRLGPSAAAVPGEPGYERTVRTFRLIQLVEGKRPDLVAFEPSVWTSFTETEQRCASEWPMRFLTTGDADMLGRCSFGIEVKNSLWHYETRRRAGKGPLAVTMKEEERRAFENWTRQTGRPIVFVQVFFDEIYCMSFARMTQALQRGFMYEQGDVVTEKEQKSGKKTHKFLLQDSRHCCGRVEPPNERSGGRIKISPEGQVALYMVLEPAIARDVDEPVIAGEVQFRI